MRDLRYLLLIALLATACKEQAAEEPLLLLDNGSAAEKLSEPAGPVADNSRCHVCHINYEDEALTFVHARADIGCEQCHGPSDAHCSDEDNITPPDIMYPAAEIGPFCMGCHTRDEIKIAVHNSIWADIDTQQGSCTACHGEHRLSHRTRMWDKATGDLIEDDKVRMLTN